MTTEAHPAFGYYGKIPGTGDFIRRDLSPGFTEPWDAWLQGLIIDGRGMLGQGWQDAYFTAPIWRFTLPADVAGPEAVIGTLMPSVDRVGRQFPFTLAGQIPGRPDAWTLHRAAGETFEVLETISLAMLEDDVERAWLDNRLHDLVPPTPRPVAEVAPGAGVLAVTALPGETGAALAGEAIAARHARPCLFSALLDGQERLLVSNGLPTADDGLALITLASPVWGNPAAESLGDTLADPVADILSGGRL
ncbi:MAG: type VI secretion system-associated protein TagF [Pseudomonadota bacterium]